MVDEEVVNGGCRVQLCMVEADSAPRSVASDLPSVLLRGSYDILSKRVQYVGTDPQGLFMDGITLSLRLRDESLSREHEDSLQVTDQAGLRNSRAMAASPQRNRRRPGSFNRPALLELLELREQVGKSDTTQLFGRWTCGYEQ